MRSNSMRRCWESRARLGLAAAILMLALSAGWADVAQEVLALTGARTKIVWVHLAPSGAGIGRGKNWDAVEPDYELMAFDTADGRARILLSGPASYANPCISPDGETVFYTDYPANTIYAVGWDGRGKKALTQGYVLCAWKNPADGTQWIYFTDGGYSRGPVIRCRADDPAIREVVWRKDQATHTFTVSADGTHAGSGFPWPLAGVAILPDVYWRQYGNGCNAGIAPDNSYRLMHMGEKAEHNGVMMYDNGGVNKRMVSFTGLPGRRPQDDSWIPRWSSDVRFFTLNSPAGGELADIYLGQFDETFTRVVNWLRITDQGGQDTKACCWIDPGLGRYEGEAPYSIEVPATLTPGGDWVWDFGDGSAKGTAVSGKHTYPNPGGYALSARKGDLVLKGWARIREQKAPQVADVRLFDETHLMVAFDERVQLKDAKVTLASRVPVKAFSLDPEGLRLSIELAGRVNPQDALELEGVLDRAQVPNSLKRAKIAVTRPVWPADRAGLVFLWETSQKRSFEYHAPTQSFVDTRFVTLKKARPDRDGALQLDGGIVSFIDAASGLVSESARANQFSLEATITPANLCQGYPGGSRQIVACDAEQDRNLLFALGQEGNKLVFLLRHRTPQDQTPRGSVQRVEVCKLVEAVPSHVVVTYRPGRLACYLNGQLVKETDEVKGVLLDEKPAFDGGLHLGGTSGSVYPWRGKVEGLAMYTRILGPAEVAANHASYSAALAKRKVVVPVEIEAKLVAMSEIPRAADIAPYRDALIVNEYEVIKVRRGRNPGKKLRVSQWGLIETEPTSLARAKPGDVMRFAVEPIADHSELEAEVTRDTLPEDFETPPFLDVTPQPSGTPRVDKITVHPGEIWMAAGDTAQFRADMLDQYGNPVLGRLKWSAAGGGAIDVGNAYGAGNYFIEKDRLGEGAIDANGLFVAGGRPGVVTITAASADDPHVKGTAIVGFGQFPAVHPADRAPLRFGVKNDDSRAFSGDLDRIRLYSRGLTGDEIAGHAAGKSLDIQDDALVGDWTFDVARDGGYPNIVTTGLTARVIGEVEPVDDKGGRYVRLRGKGFLEVAQDPRLDCSKALTVECWIRPRGTGCLVSKEIVWSWGYQFSLEEGRMTIDTFRTGAYEPLSGEFMSRGDRWQHVVAVLEGMGGQRLYLDGKAVAERKPHPMVLRE